MTFSAFHLSKDLKWFVQVFKEHPLMVWGWYGKVYHQGKLYYWKDKII